MSWNKTLLHSLKSRTVLLYALLFLVSYTIVFVIVYLHLLRAEKEETDWRLHRIFSAFEYRYFTGEELRNSLVVLPKFSRIPKELFRHIAEEVAGFLPVLACRETRNRDSYIVFGFRGKEIWRVTYETDPPHFSKERILPEEHTAVLAKDFAQESFGEGARLVSLLLDRNRRIVASSPSVEPDRERFRRFDYAHSSARLHYGDMENSRGRRIRLAWKSLPDGNMLVIGLNQHAADENLDRIVNAFWGGGAAVFALSVLCAWILSCRMVRGIQRVGAAADRIAAGDYSCRVPLNNDGCEIDSLVASFNTMTGNTETLMSELRTIADDIAHDLRTPLTRMIGRSEVTVSGNPTLEDALNTLGDNAEECRAMLALINQMLEISKTESGAIVPDRRELDLSALLERSVELFRLPAEQKNQEIVLNIPERPVRFSGDAVKLQRLAGNLLDNAMKFTPPHGRITVALKRTDREVVLSVSDTGCGIPPEEREKVFKRFFRADSSRHLPGNGLGLALVQAIAKAHGGSVGLESEPGHGSVFTVRLPV